MQTMSDIGNYLDASRNYIENAKNRLAQMGYCCPYSILGDLIEEQDRLDLLYYQEMQKSNSIGYFWLIAAGASLLVTLGSYVYSHYAKAKTQADYLECLAKYQAIYEATNTKERAAQLAEQTCGGSGGSILDELSGTIKTAIYGGVIVFGLYVLNQIMSKKR